MAFFIPPAVREVPSTSMSLGKRMSNIFSMSRNKATSVIESRPSCTGYTAVESPASPSGRAGAGTARIEWFVVHIFIAGSYPGVHFTGQVQSVRRNFEAIPADTEAEPP